MRVLGGVYKGSKLKSPAGRHIRPTSVRAREAIFNVLIHGLPEWTGIIEEAIVLDLFCGTGALGIEALSRGASQVTFIERDEATMDIVQANASFGPDAIQRTIFLRLDATILPPFNGEAPSDIAFLDPPYGKNLAVPALIGLKTHNWLSRGALVVIETEKEARFHPPPEYSIIDVRTFGITKVCFLILVD